MPIEYEMMFLKREVEAAVLKISGASEFTDEDANRLLNFWEAQSEELALLSESQRKAVDEMRRRGYWLKMDDSTGRPILYRAAHD